MKNFNCKLIDLDSDKFLTEWNTAVVPDIGDKIKISDSDTLFVVQREFNVKDNADVKVLGMLNV